MQEIRLHTGALCLVDDADYEELAQFRWREYRHTHIANPTSYAVRYWKEGGKQLREAMHRRVLGLPKARPLVDHINGNGLDNQRGNLRTCTTSQNGFNRGAQANNKSSGVKNVYWHKQRGYWCVRVKAGDVYRAINCIDTMAEAVLIAEGLRSEMHGMFTNHKGSK
jgi:hypothetical protein